MLTWTSTLRILIALLIPIAGAPGSAAAQLPRPAADVAEELLAVARSGDRDRIREFVQARFTTEFVNAYPLDEYHVPVLASFGRQIQGLEVAATTLNGPFGATLLLTGPGTRLDVRVQVEPEAPHGIASLGWGPAGPEINARTLADVGSELRRLADVPPFSGVVLVVQDGTVLLHEAYGSADLATGRRNQPDTRFDVGSLYKLFTSTAVLRLSEEGRIDLDHPIGRYLDGFPANVAERVTIRHLLEHRSGFGDYLTHPRFQADPKRFTEPAAFLPLAREQALRFEPGSGRQYSNMGFVLLGALLESAAGRPFHDVIDELVFRPARMESAGPAAGELAARRYELDEGRFEATDALYPDVGSPAGGGFAAAVDLQRFIDALLGHRLLSERNTSLLLNDFERAAEDAGLPEEFAFSGGAPGVAAIVMSRPAERQIVIVLGNIGPFAGDAIARRILELLE